MALTDGLVSYWKLDEASGTRFDAVVATGNDLSDVNTVTSATGVIGDAAFFVNANNEQLSIADNASWTNIPGFTYTYWVNHTAQVGIQGHISKDDGGASREFNLQTNGAGLQGYVWNQAGALGFVTTGATGLVSGTWAFCVFSWDLATIRWSKDLGVPLTAALVGTTVFNGTATFKIGGTNSAVQGMNGAIDEVGYWNRVLTAPELTELYNAGVGLTYPFGSGDTPKSSFRNAIRIGL